MPRNLDRILNIPWFALDHLIVLEDIAAFLDFSEKSIQQQKPPALEKAELDAMDIEEEYRFTYREQKIESVNFKFDVALPMRVRYAALTAFTSTIEWSMAALKPASKFPLTPKRKSNTVHRLMILSDRCGLNHKSNIECVEFLIWVRNSIMHNAGILKGYAHESEIRSAIEKYQPGFAISNWHFIGDAVEIKRGALEPIFKIWSDALEEIMTVATKKKLILFN